MNSLRARNCLIHIWVSAVGAGLAWSPTTGWGSSMGNQCQMGNFQMDQKEVCPSFLSWEDLGVTLWWYQLKVKMRCERNVRQCPFIFKLPSYSPPRLTLRSAEVWHKQLAHVGDWTWVGCEAFCEVTHPRRTSAKSCETPTSWLVVGSSVCIKPHVFSFLFSALC